MTKQAIPETFPTMGPRPLALHLAIQNMMFAGSLSALQSLKSDSIDWKGSLAPQAKSLREKIQKIDPEEFDAALGQEIQRRVSAFSDGVTRYQGAPRPEPMAPLPGVWSEGTTRLLRAEADGAPVIVIPSLVNRMDILDLAPKRSLLRTLQDRGLDTYVVDWDEPGLDELGFSIDHYVDRLERIRDVVTERCGTSPSIIGYCMGGNLALALAHRDADRIARMALLATPWDFHAMPRSAIEMLEASMPTMRQLITGMKMLPVDVIQSMFSSRDPVGVIRKFRAFADLAGKSAAVTAFVELEDWLNDGVPLAGPVALECLQEWYVENRPMRGIWESGGEILDPAYIGLPTLVVVPEHDTIVPPSSAEPLASLLPQATLMRANAGHIGMVAGSKARKQLYEPLGDWICAVQ